MREAIVNINSSEYLSEYCGFLEIGNSVVCCAEPIPDGCMVLTTEYEVGL